MLDDTVAGFRRKAADGPARSTVRFRDALDARGPGGVGFRTASSIRSRRRGRHPPDLRHRFAFPDPGQAPTIVASRRHGARRDRGRGGDVRRSPPRHATPSPEAAVTLRTVSAIRRARVARWRSSRDGCRGGALDTGMGGEPLSGDTGPRCEKVESGTGRRGAGRSGMRPDPPRPDRLRARGHRALMARRIGSAPEPVSHAGPQPSRADALSITRSMVANSSTQSIGLAT